MGLIDSKAGREEERRSEENNLLRKNWKSFQQSELQKSSHLWLNMVSHYQTETQQHQHSSLKYYQTSIHHFCYNYFLSKYQVSTWWSLWLNWNWVTYSVVWCNVFFHFQIQTSQTLLSLEDLCFIRPCYIHLVNRRIKIQDGEPFKQYLSTAQVNPSREHSALLVYNVHIWEDKTLTFPHTNQNLSFDFLWPLDHNPGVIVSSNHCPTHI